MRKTASFATIFGLILTAAVCAQEKPATRPDVAAERPLGAPSVQPAAVGMQPSVPEAAFDDQEFTISKQVDEVNLILSVTDSKGRFVDNLTTDDLKLLDDHKPPERWNYFQARTNLPLSVILAVDISSSVRDRLKFEQQAASTFLKHILRKETDEAAVISFASSVQENTAGMTADVNSLDGSIRALRAGGETAMYDAIILASHKLRANRRHTLARPVIILITDGMDTASKGTLRAAEEAATRSEATILALDANSIYEKSPKGRPVLEKLTHDTGGFVLSARENSDLKHAFSTIEKILRSQYALGYPPPDLEPNGKFRPIEVTCNKQGLKIHARNGYYSPAK